MEATTPRTSVWKSTYALVVISPAMTTNPVAVNVSQATRLWASSLRQASRMASEIWSAILSGWPSVTDSDVNKKLSLGAKGPSSWMKSTASNTSLEHFNLNLCPVHKQCFAAPLKGNAVERGLFRGEMRGACSE